jgi:hypothetical protein
MVPIISRISAESSTTRTRIVFLLTVFPSLKKRNRTLLRRGYMVGCPVPALFPDGFGATRSRKEHAPDFAADGVKMDAADLRSSEIGRGNFKPVITQVA